MWRDGALPCQRKRLSFDPGGQVRIVFGRRAHFLAGYAAYGGSILDRPMYLRTLREYAEAKEFWITTGLGLVALVVAFAAAKGLLWISAAVALCFMVGYPTASLKNRWHLYGRGEKIWQVGSTTFLLIDLSYMIVRGLVEKGAESLFSNFGFAGIDVVLALTFFLLYVWVPQWGRGRKECPDCLTTTGVAARACSGCGYHWPAEPPQAERGSAAATAPL
jgi:hypothetical protein